MKSRAIVCVECGAKFRAGLRRCPRCRALTAPPDPAVIAASSRRLRRMAGGLVAVAGVLLATGWLMVWPERAAPLASTVAATSVSRPVPAAPPPAAAPESRPRLEVERPFMDPPAAAYSAYTAGDMPAALRHFEEALAKNPNDPDVLSNLGQVLVRLERTAEAIPFFERAIAIVPDRWTYRFNLARALGVLGRWDEAVASYRQAQQLFPDDYVTAFNLGLALRKAGDDRAAVTAFQKAIALDPREPSFRMALAMTYERLQQATDAAATYEEALRLSPEAPDADAVRRRVAQLRAGGRS